jgi:hypothetical protein
MQIPFGVLKIAGGIFARLVQIVPHQPGNWYDLAERSGEKK